MSTHTASSVPRRDSRRAFLAKSVLLASPRRALSWPSAAVPTLPEVTRSSSD